LILKRSIPAHGMVDNINKLTRKVSLQANASFIKYNDPNATPTAAYSTRLVINLHEESIRRLGYTFLTVASNFGSKRGVVSPFNNTYYDNSYPTQTTLPTETSTTRVSVGTAAKATIEFVKHLRSDIDDIAPMWDDISKNIRGSSACGCPTAADGQKLSDQWLNFNKTLGIYVKITSTKYSLIGYTNSTIVAKIEQIFNATTLFIVAYDKCHKCLLDNIKNGGARDIKKYCNNVNMESISMGESDVSCIAHGNRAIARITRNVREELALRERQEERIQVDMMERMYNQYSRSIALLDLGVTNFQKNVSYVIPGEFRRLRLS
jgi:hypothetical protein